MDMITKQYQVVSKQLDDLTFEATINTADKDRVGDIVMPTGMKIENYMKNPVVPWAHDYSAPPVAKALMVGLQDTALVAKFTFPDPGVYDFADTIRKLWAGGFLNAVSIGFIPLKWVGHDGQAGSRDQDNWFMGGIVTEAELLEVSLVPVPANQNALRRIFEPPIVKSAIPYKKHPLADEADAWDGPAEVAAADTAALKIMCAWYDSENPDVKSSYKLPHHKADGDHATVWRGVTACMAVMMGGRGGVNIPDEDRAAVMRHISRHYEDFGKTPPESRGMNMAATYPDLPPDYVQALAELKEGRVLSTKNRELITTAVSSMQGAIGALQDLLDATDPGQGDDKHIAPIDDPNITLTGLPDDFIERLRTTRKEIAEVLK